MTHTNRKPDGWFITHTEKNGEVKELLIARTEKMRDEFVAKGYGARPFVYLGTRHGH